MLYLLQYAEPLGSAFLFWGKDKQNIEVYMLINNLYYRLYCWAKKAENILTPKNLRMPEYIALFTILILFQFNLWTIDLVLEYIDIGPFIDNSKNTGLVVIFIMLGCLYFLFIRKRKYLLVVEKYKSETKKEKIISTLLTVIYIIFTVVSLIIVSK